MRVCRPVVSKSPWWPMQAQQVRGRGSRARAPHNSTCQIISQQLLCNHAVRTCSRNPHGSLCLYYGNEAGRSLRLLARQPLQSHSTLMHYCCCSVALLVVEVFDGMARKGGSQAQHRKLCYNVHLQSLRQQCLVTKVTVMHHWDCKLRYQRYTAML